MLLFLFLGTGCTTSVPPALQPAPEAPRFGRSSPDLPTSLDSLGQQYGVGPAGINALVEKRHMTLANGSIIQYQPVFSGIPVLNSTLTVALNLYHQPIAWSVDEGFGPALGGTRTTHSPPQDALLTALSAIGPIPQAVTPTHTPPLDGWETWNIPNHSHPARVRPVLWASGRQLLAAHQIELWPEETLEVIVYQNQILRQRNLTFDASFSYRVWADAQNAPTDNPMSDFSPHPTGTPDGSTPNPTAPTLITLDSLNTNADPWLESTATETSGNNVDAYTDYNDDGYTSGDFRADLTSPTTFDRTYDLNLDPIDTTDQAKAAITQAFFTTNWLHDWYYDAGFTETLGNGQAANYGRGGVENDAMHVRVQDGLNRGYSNNASMSTPADGDTPTMRLYLWSGNPRVDVALDNTVVAHEWGHFLHHRLASCGQQQCAAMSEGWGDFVALHMMLRDGDNLAGAYPVGTYAWSGLGNDPYFYGIRQSVYSTDPLLNALSFRHITDNEPLPATSISNGNDNSEVHNAGEVWATTLWDAYTELQATRDANETFDDIQLRMSEIVVAGLLLTPPDATYLEGRDALLAATSLASPDDLGTLWATFAGRGMGSCAIAPDRNSTDFSGVVEDFSVDPVLSIETPVFTDGDHSCDNDGYLDGGERGKISIWVTNTGGSDLVGAQLQLSADLATVSFPSGDTQVVPDLPPYQSAELSFDLDLDRSATATTLNLTATLSHPDACTSQVQSVLSLATETDIAYGNADSFEIDAGGWTLEGTDAEAIWARIESGPLAWSWLGTDLSGIYDARLVSPELVVDTSGSLLLSFSNRWSFESSSGIDWDGGVLEVRVNRGAWQDVSDYLDPGYTGIISNLADNPLSDQQAYTGTNASWPSMDLNNLDFGSVFAGQVVEFAFRIGTDQAAGEVGWEVDDVIVSGITNAPFPYFTAQVDVCDPAPTADAGPDQTVASDTTVTLDGSASADPWGEPLTYQWTQTQGSPVILSDSTAVGPTFIAPHLLTDEVLSLTLEVQDGNATATDSVDILVLASTDYDLDGHSSQIAGGDDCDDQDGLVYPGAADAWYDGLDTDCAGNNDFDADADGFSALLYGGDDCEDGDAGVYPGAVEVVGDGIDQDCDGMDAVVEDSGGDSGAGDSGDSGPGDSGDSGPGDSGPDSSPGGDSGPEDSGPDSSPGGDSGPDSEPGSDSSPGDDSTETRDTGKVEDGKCGCDTSPSGLSAVLLLSGLAMTRRRRNLER